jgi:hypothetical protein
MLSSSSSSSSNAFPFLYTYKRTCIKRDDDLKYIYPLSLTYSNTCDSLQNYIDMEIKVQRHIFERMQCNDEMIEKTLEQIRLTLLSQKQN